MLSHPTPGDDEPEHIKTIRKLFNAKLPEQMATLDASWTGLSAGDDASVQDAIRGMFRVAHDISGTAEAFGGARLGDAAAALAGKLRPYRDGSPTPSTESIEEVGRLVEGLKQSASDYLMEWP